MGHDEETEYLRKGMEVLLGRIEKCERDVHVIKRALKGLAEMRGPRRKDIDALAAIRQEGEEENNDHRDSRAVQLPDA